MFQNVQAKNHVKTFLPIGVCRTLCLYKVYLESQASRKFGALRIGVGTPHFPAVSSKSRQRLSAAATPIEECARRMRMVPQ